MNMDRRKLGGSNVSITPVGFDARFIGTEAWDHLSDEETVELLSFAANRGVGYFDTGAAYGDGRSEELLGRALAGDEEVCVGTRIGRGNANGEGDFSPEKLEAEIENSLDRLGRDSLDVVFLHEPKVDEVDEATLGTLHELREKGFVRALGWELGPGVGWVAEGERAIEYDLDAIGLVFNALEQGVGRHLIEEIEAAGADTKLLARAPHSSGLLTEQIDRDTSLEPIIERTGRPQEWFEAGFRKVERLRFLEQDGRRTIGEAAIQWLLSHEEVAAVTPAMRTGWDVKEFVKAPDTPSLTDVERRKVDLLYDEGFGVDVDDGTGPEWYGSSVEGEDLRKAGILSDADE